MNKKILSFSTAILFSLFFFKRDIGLNMLLFSVLTTLILALLFPNKFKDKKVLMYTGFYLVSSTLIFFYNSSLTIITSLISFFVLLGAVIERKSSIYVLAFNGLYTTIASIFATMIQQLNEETTAVKKRKINYIYWFKMIGIPLITVFIFSILYRSANPYFNGIIQKIDLSFINMQLVLFTLMGYFLMLNIINPIEIEPLTSLDLKTSNILVRNTKKEQSTESLIQENQLGIVLFIVLNSLLLFFLITDVLYISRITDLRASDLSKAVHEGVYALITSIVFAITIILYFFRGNLNFFNKNKNLRLLTFIWIALNIVLVFITSYKNYLYVIQYGFTYKRIGVYIYLSLSLIGLITTFFKVSNVYNLWYLFRKNMQMAYLLLILLSTVNWDKFITYYNTDIANITDLDYLIRLSDNNTLMLKEYTGTHPNIGTYREQREVLLKYHVYIEKLEGNSWQELVYDNLKL